MGPASVAQAAGGLLLLFVLPGALVAKAVFPERRVRGPNGLRWALELAALGLVLSVVLTVLVGELLLTVAPGGFHASWSDPLLEEALAGIAAVAFVAGWLQGAYARTAPPPRASELPPEQDPWQLSVDLDRLQRQRLRLERQLARGAGAAAPEIEGRLEELRRQERSLRERQEASYFA